MFQSTTLYKVMLQNPERFRNLVLQAMMLKDTISNNLMLNPLTLSNHKTFTSLFFFFLIRGEKIFQFNDLQMEDFGFHP